MLIIGYNQIYFLRVFDMHLKHLKLAGFKSFVEPTTVPFASQLVAVVGPNGCGKSNIIDAVRWVMGESSAKNLRGDSMTDVIFNGSSNRKSVGQASVELVFDNSLGRLTGEYASYQEIAVKRLVTRDGDSFYYLNGSRCRRRDITDIFLGTGAGARGYSIIGQDTISRLIEARPDDLRAYLEEAAGVSKYKERRRETLQRIHHTRENLARVADIRDELDKQLSRLERQATSAERYKRLKEDARLCKADILAIKWREVESEQGVVKQELRQLTLQLEHHRTSIAGFIKENVYLKEQLQTAQGDFQQTQTQFYQLSTDIARLEESIQQQQREQQRIAEDERHMRSELHVATEQLAQDNQMHDTCAEELALLQARMDALKEELHQRQQGLDDLRPQKINWETQWQTTQAAFHQSQREVQVEQVRLQHIEQRCQQTQISVEKNQLEHEQLVVEPLQYELTQLQAQHENLIRQHQIDGEHHQKAMEATLKLREQLTTVEQQMHKAQDKLQVLITEHAALHATQNAALRHTNNRSPTLPQWDKNPRLAEVITVPDKWLRACEVVLDESLQAIVLDSMETLWPEFANLKEQSAVFVQKAEHKVADSALPRLSDHITGGLPCWINALDQIFAAENLAEALSWLPLLNSQQSVVTPDGYWLGSGWARFDGSLEHDEPGLLLRQQTLAKLTDTLANAQEDVGVLQTNRDQIYAYLVENEREASAYQQALSTSREAVRESDSSINTKQQALERAMTRHRILGDEQEELHVLLEELAAQKLQAQHNEQRAMQAVEGYEQELQQLSVTKTSWEDALLMSQSVVDDTKDALHQTELQCNRETLKIQQLRDSMMRGQRHIEALSERLTELDKKNKALGPLFNEHTKSLHEKITMHHQLDGILAGQRQRTDELQQQLQEKERLSQQAEQYVNVVQEKIQQRQLQDQALTIRADNLLESLAALHVDLVALLATLSVDVTLDMREQTLLVLEEKIQRLGAINLVAIEEYQTELERRQQLDEQYQDLMDALTTLDTAISKMDKETQLRLKDTFDQVNQSFQALFPRLFEGGHARLELTCDNLLEAGIVVMAQPPGKRNGTIHLLSGGEKAMTAVALVFAIFQLNPSPFCMLDEVDAPLDEANVRRFCELVKEMSEFVQFLFITHNKVTMELADHLIGVTMREPGVSRIVAVNVEEALAQCELG
jgi:chromosome segregation protein